jgi:hypothetical protein
MKYKRIFGYIIVKENELIKQTEENGRTIKKVILEQINNKKVLDDLNKKGLSFYLDRKTFDISIFDKISWEIRKKVKK